MIKILIALVAFLLLAAGYIAHPILAGGDKVRGDLGVGTVEQVCYTPFGPDGIPTAYICTFTE